MENTMRRKDREIADFTKILEIIDRCDCCRLGLVDGNEAYIVPMNFGYEVVGEQLELYFHCAKEGRKVDLLSKQCQVSFEMDTGHELVGGTIGCDFSYLYQSVMGIGTITVLSEKEEKMLGLQKILKHYTGQTQWEFQPKLLERTKVLKLSVKTLSCKEH